MKGGSISFNRITGQWINHNYPDSISRRYAQAEINALTILNIGNYDENTNSYNRDSTSWYNLDNPEERKTLNEVIGSIMERNGARGVKILERAQRYLIDAIGGREHDQMRHAKNPHDGHRVYLVRLEDLNTLLESYINIGGLAQMVDIDNNINSYDVENELHPYPNRRRKGAGKRNTKKRNTKKRNTKKRNTKKINTKKN